MKSPAFQWYPNDFLGSGKVAAMSLEEVGAYSILLCYDWNEVGLPNELAPFSRWLRTTPKKARALWDAVKSNFTLRDGRWYNPRLEKERAKQTEWREKSRRGGQASAQARWSHVDKGGDKGGYSVVGTIGQPMGQPNGNTPSPIPSPTAVTTKGKRPKATEQPSPFPKSVCDALYESWVSKRGAIDYGAFRKALAPLYPAAGPRFTDAQLSQAIEAHAEYVSILSPKDARFESVHTFAQNADRWVRLGAMPGQFPDGSFTERGRLIVGDVL